MNGSHIRWDSLQDSAGGMTQQASKRNLVR